MPARLRRNDGRRGSRTPKARRPTRFRDGVPLRWQSFQMAPAGLDPAPPRVRAGRSASLSYGAFRCPAGIEPAAPAFRRALYRLSYGHTMGALAYPSTLDRRPPAAHTRADVVLRGGALEPGASTLLGKSQAKAHAYSSALFPSAMLRAFLSQAGPRFELDLLQAEHHLDLDMTVRLQKRRRRPGWVALERIAMRLGI